MSNLYPGSPATMPRSSSSTVYPTERPTASATQQNVEESEEPQTRRALVRNAVDGLQRFKQSWKSVMLLKAGVGLGQVIVLVVLLILAAIIQSPQFPSLTQNQASEACTHPELFQAWMGVQIARLTICWSVSCWMCIRTERARRQRREERELEENVGLESQSSERMAGTTTGIELRRNVESFSSRLAPTLVHSTSSTSTLLASVTHPSTPHTAYNPRASSSRIDLSRVLEDEQIPGHDNLGSPDVAKPRPGALMPQSQSADSNTVLLASAPDRSLRERQSMRNLRQARELRNGDVEAGVDGDMPATGFAGWLDKHAFNISRTLGGISTVLFLLGNILLFYPPPSNNSCYSANPLLWWGVLTVTAVGWVLLLQVFFVVVIVGLGGAVVLNTLQRLGITLAPAEPELARPAQPEPLNQSELDRIKLVCYLPESSEISVSRLPLPPVYLSANQSTCAICQENFEEPKEGRTILLKADKLRLLGCSHVYHMDCIDQWLLKGSGNCPACNAPVRPSLPPVLSVPSTPATPQRGRARRGDVYSPG